MGGKKTKISKNVVKYNVRKECRIQINFCQPIRGRGGVQQNNERVKSPILPLKWGKLAFSVML